MEISRGTIGVTGSSISVTGDASALFKRGAPPVEIGDILRVDATLPYYMIASVDSDTSLKLSRKYQGGSSGSIAYTITKSFYRNLNMARVNKGDIELAEIMHRNFKLLDSNFSHTAPASATVTGRKGMYAFDASYFYICVATNTWQRIAIATW